MACNFACPQCRRHHVCSVIEVSRRDDNEGRSVRHSREKNYLGSCGQHKAKESLMAPRVWQPLLADDKQAVGSAFARGWAYDDEEALHILQALCLLHCHAGPVELSRYRMRDRVIRLSIISRQLSCCTRGCSMLLVSVILWPVHLCRCWVEGGCPRPKA